MTWLPEHGNPVVSATIAKQAQVNCSLASGPPMYRLDIRKIVEKYLFGFSVTDMQNMPNDQILLFSSQVKKMYVNFLPF